MQPINPLIRVLPPGEEKVPNARIQEVCADLSALQAKSAAELAELKKSSILDQKAPAINEGTFAHVHCGRTARATLYEEKQSPGTGQRRHELPIHQGSVSLLKEVVAWIDSGQGIAGKKIISESIRECSDQLHKTVQELQALAKEPNEDVFRAGVHRHAEGVADQLAKLPAGKSFVIPVGAAASAMYLRFIGRGNGTFDLRLYTAQQGSEKLQEGKAEETECDVKPMFVFNNVPADAIYGKQAFMLDVLIGTAVADKPVTAMNILSLFQHIAGHHVPASKEISHYIRTQRSQIDSQKALNALLLDMSSDHDNFKRITINTRLLTLVAQYQQLKPVLSKRSADRNQLRIAADNLMKSVYEYAKGTSPLLSEQEARLLLGTALDLVDRINEIERIGQPDGAKIEPIVSNVLNEAERARAVVDSFTPPAVAKPVELKAILPPEFPRFSGRMDEFHKFLPAFRKAIDALCAIDVAPSIKGKLYAESIIEELLFNLPIGSTAWSAIPEAERMQCINEMGILLERYCQSLTETAPNPTRASQHVALMSFYAHIDCLARLCDTDGFLKGLAVDDLNFERALTEDMFHQIKSPLLLSRRSELFNYFQSVKKEAPGSDTFELFDWKQSIDPEEFDHTLCSRLLKSEKIRSKIPKDVAEKWSGRTGDEALLAYLHVDCGKSRGIRMQSGYFYEEIAIPTVLVSVPHILRLKQASIAMRILFSKNSEKGYRKTDSFVEFGFSDSQRGIEDLCLGGCKLKFKSDRYGDLPSFSERAAENELRTELKNMQKSGLFVVNPGRKQEELGSRWVPENEAYSYVGMLKPSDYHKKEWGKISRWDIIALMEPRDVAPLNIIQWMQSHSHELSESKLLREQFNMMLFQPYYDAKRKEQVALFNILAKNPNAILPSLRTFISETLDTYYRLRPGRTPIMPMVTFALQLASQVERAYSEIHRGMAIHPPLYDAAAVAEILNHNNEEVFLKEAEVKTLLACQMTHWFPCRDPASVSNRDLLEATALWVELGGMLSTSLLHRDLSESLGEGRNQLSKEIAFRSADPQFQRAFIETLAERLRLTVPKDLWKAVGVMVYEAKDDEGNQWQIDLFRGRLFFNGKPTTSPTLRPESKLWNYLFGNRKHEIKSTGEISTFQDPAYGAMRCFSDGKNIQIERLIGEFWFTCLAPDSKEVCALVPNALRAGHSFFMARNPNAPYRMVICDLKTGAVKYGQTAQGELVAQSSGLVAILEPNNKVFTQFAPASECVTWRNQTEKSASRQTFPRLCTTDGSKVAFKRDGLNGDWIYEANPSYVVRDPQIQNLFPHCANYLVLQKKGEKGLRILMLEGDEVESKAYSTDVSTSIKPQDPWAAPEMKTVHSYRVKHGELDADTPTEDLFYLARLQLAGKDYDRAMESLRKIGEGEAISSKARELLKTIIQPTDSVPDRSSEASAVRLRALWLAMRTDLQGAKDLFDDKVGDLFNDYYDGLVRVPDNVALKPWEELPLLEVWRKMRSDSNDRGRYEVVKMALGKSEEYATRIDLWGAAGSSKSRFIWDEVPSAPPFNFDVLDPPANVRAAGIDMMTFEHLHKAYKKNCNYVESCLLASGVAPNVPQLPIYGDDNLSCHQFYHCYEQLCNASTDAERRSLAYVLDNFTSHELSQDDKDKEFPAAVRLDILRCVYHNPKGSPPLPQERGNKDAWLTWLKDFDKALPTEPATNRVPKQVVYPADRQQVQGKTIRKTPTHPVSLKTAPGIEIDKGLKQFRDAYFDSEKAPPVKAQPPLKRQRIAERDKPYAKGIDKEFELLEEESKIAHEQRAAQTVYKLKPTASRKESLDNLRHYLGAEKGAEMELSKMEQLVLELSKQRDVREIARMAKQESRELKDPTLPQLVRACLAGTEEAYKKLNPFLHSNDIQKLHDCIVELMLATTNVRQLQRVECAMTRCIEASIDVAEQDAEWKDAVDELMAQRHYGCLTIDEIKQNMPTIYFEYKTAMRVKEKQVGLINALAKRISLLSPEQLRHIVFQLMMGGGKTSVILSALMDIIATALDEKRIPALILHPTQFDGVLGNLRAYQRERYGQEIISIDYSREELANVDTLKAIKDQLDNALEQGHGIAMKSTMPRTFLLELREICANFYRDKQPIDTHRAQLLGQILQTIRDKTIFLTDEVDLCLDIIQQLNFPRGEAQHLSLEEIELIQNLFDFIRKEKLIDFSPGAGATSEEVYEKKVLPKLLEYACTVQQVPDSLRAGYKRFLTNTLDGRVEEEMKPNLKVGGLSWEAFNRQFDKGWYFSGSGKEIELEFDEEQTQVKDWAYLRYNHYLLAVKGGKEGRHEAGMQGLMRFVLSKVLPRMLSLEMDRHRGYVGDKTGKVAPFVGRKAPAPTQMANPYEATCAHMYCGLTLGLEDGSVEFLAKKWHEAAEQKAKRHQQGGYEGTKEATKFFELTGVPLFEAQQGKRCDEALKNLNENPSKMLAFQAGLAQHHATFYDSFLSSEAYDLPELTSANIACSGTPWNLLTYSRFENPLLDIGTMGAILNELRRQGAGQKPHIIDTSKGVVKGFLNLIQKRKAAALIDTGGVVEDCTGLEFAKAYLEHFKDDPNRNAVVFFHRDKNRQGFATLKRGDDKKIPKKPTWLPDTKPETIRNNDIDMKKMFVYFEESKTTGIDFKLPCTSLALLTFNPHYTTFRSMGQGAARMRYIFGGQIIEHVMAENQLPFYDNEVPMVDDLIATSFTNQGREKCKLATRSAREKIPHTPRAQVDQNLIDTAASKPAELTPFSAKFGQYLDSYSKPDLFSQFCKVTSQVDAKPKLAELRKDELDKAAKIDPQFAKSLEPAFAKLEKTTEALDAAGFLAAKIETPDNEATLDKQLQIALEQEQEEEHQAEQEVDLDNETVQTLRYYDRSWNLKSTDQLLWKNLHTLNGGLPGKEQGVNTLKLTDHINSTKDVISIAAFPKDLPLYCSQNFITGVGSDILKVLQPGHKMISHLLVCCDEGQQPKVMVLTQEELKQFTQAMGNRKDGKYYIVNLRGQPVDGATDLPSKLKKNLELKRCLWFANMFNGNLDYLLSVPEETEEMMREAGQVRRKFLQIRLFMAPQYREIIRSLSDKDFNVGRLDDKAKEALMRLHKSGPMTLLLTSECFNPKPIADDDD